MNAADRHARKQVLLTRIAFQREQLRLDLRQVRHAAEPQQLVRAVLGESLGGTVGRTLFGDRPHHASDLLGQALAWMRRYRVAAALVGGVLPALRGRGRWRRVLRLSVIAGAAWLGWSIVRKREP